VEDITIQLDSDMERRHMEVGTSSQHPRGKGKHPMARSLCGQPDATIILSFIPEGVQTTPTLLGCMEKLKYSDHDVADAGKFPEVCTTGVLGQHRDMPLWRPNITTKAMGSWPGQHRDSKPT
jgi:hypothetical protein